MKLHELLGPPKVLLEGQHLAVFNALLPLLLIEQDEGAPPGGDGGGGLPAPPPTAPGAPPAPTPVPCPAPPGVGGYYGGWGPGPFRPGGGMNANRWFDELYATVKNLAIASKIDKRLKELGVKNAGAKRVKKVVRASAKRVRHLMLHPGATVYRLQGFTTATPPKQAVKTWNESFERAFREELSKIDLTED